MNQKIICTIFLITSTICLLASLIQGKPVAAEDHSGEYNGDLDDKTIEQLRYCDRDLETMELCMRCAKVTKSTIVYPLCCANEDGVKDWCNAYVYFGISRK